MQQKETKPLVCKSHLWVQSDTLIWYHATVYHGNEPRTVKRFCGDQCSFPACLGEAVRSDEARESIADISTRDREAREGKPYTRSFFEQHSDKQEVDEK
jgi:hypothetical protein